jgi:hypothetical protein
LDFTGLENQERLVGLELNDSPGLVAKWLLTSNEGWGGEPPIRRVLRPDHTRKIMPHTTSLKREKAGRVWSKRGADAREKGRRKNSGNYRVSDSGEEGE